jgi:hypothetical protein
VKFDLPFVKQVVVVLKKSEVFYKQLGHFSNGPFIEI